MAKHKWKFGDRVTRHVYLDDGTWNISGDRCLKHSPLYRGTVVGRRGDEVIVVWDGADHKKYYLDHGLDNAAKIPQEPPPKSRKPEQVPPPPPPKKNGG